MLPFFKSTSRELDQLQTRWKQDLDPVVDNDLLKGRIMRNVALQSGANQLEHRLGRPLQGWFIIDLNANVSLFSPSHDSLFLNITASGPATASFYIF